MVIVCSLSYHYSVSKAHQAQAFKYAVKAAHELMLRQAYADAELQCRRASYMACKLEEVEILLTVVRRAVEELKPDDLVSNVVRRMSTAVGRRAQVATFVPRKPLEAHGLLQQFKRLNNDLAIQLIRLQQADASASSTCCLPSLFCFGNSDFDHGSPVVAIGDINKRNHLSWKDSVSVRKSWNCCSTW